MTNPLTFAEYQKRMKTVKTPEEAEGLIRELMAPTLEKLGVPRSNPSRNIGITAEEIPTFPQYQTVNTTISRVIPKVSPWRDVVDSDNEDIVVTLYAKGLSIAEIAGYMREHHDMKLTESGVSEITNKILPLAREWQTRPLSEMYPLVFLDGMRFKVRDGGKIMNKVAYIALGINQYGLKEILGIWISDTEGSKFWHQVLTEIKNRGVEDIFFVCVDGLNGFPEAIEVVFPKAEIQSCIVHQMRNSMKYVKHKDKEKYCASLKEIHMAVTEEAGFAALERAKEQWPLYQVYLRSWEIHWPELAPFFQYSLPIRKLIYTTNYIESLNGQFRRVMMGKLFPHNDALLKLLWLVQTNISQKWTAPLSDWHSMMAELHMLYPERLKF